MEQHSGDGELLPGPLHPAAMAGAGPSTAVAGMCGGPCAATSLAGRPERRRLWANVAAERDERGRGARRVWARRSAGLGSASVDAAAGRCGPGERGLSA